MSNPTWKKQGGESRWNASPRARKAAMEMLARWLVDDATREQKPALDRVVASEFRQRKQLNAGERRWISETIYGSVRFLRRQRFLLSTLGLPDTAEAHVALWAVLPTEMTGLSPLAPEQWEPILADTSSAQVEQALARLPNRDNAHEFLRVTLSFPDAMADALETLLGDEAVDAGEAFNRQAPTTIRANPLRTTRAKLQSALPDTVPTRYSPLGLELPRRANLGELTGFREGWFEAQEEASQIVTLLANPQPGQIVIEVGAGGGGKTLLLAALMQNRGRVVALDTSAVRIDALKKRAERAGVRIVTSLLVEANEEGRWQEAGRNGQNLQKWRGRGGVVFLDAPCTGSGVLRRSPDAKWRGFDSAAFVRLQSRLLAQSAALVAPGGVLVYVTCAFEREQNEAIIETFLRSQPEGFWRSEPAVDRFASAHHFVSGPYLRTWPHRHGLDAYFAACLRRCDAPAE